MRQRILLGTRKGTFIVEKANGRWTPRLAGHAGAGSNFVACDPSTGVLWAALGHGHWGAKLSRSNDDGKSWVDASQVKYPEGSRYLAPPMPGEDGEPTGAVVMKTATLLKLWVVAFGPNRPLWNHESRGGDLFAGKGSGETHWMGTPASDGEFAPGIHSILVDPKNPDHLFVAVSTAGVLESTDGGKSWRGRNRGMTNDYLPDPVAEWGHDPHFVALCAGDPKHIWQQNHCGVFYSDNGAETWRKVSQPEQGVHFGFPIAVDARDGKTAWVVPGKADMQRTAIDGALFVARTSNGGQSWEPLRRGLPQREAYDVVYRHALSNQDDLLAFGSTTGNLYVSEDRGDSWTTVANNLPPIFSVRFG